VKVVKNRTAISAKPSTTTVFFYDVSRIKVQKQKPGSKLSQ